jgi:hypothetical protein
MTIADLEAKLGAVDDKSIELLFFCTSCGKYVPLEDMKTFGFIVTKEGNNGSPN